MKNRKNLFSTGEKNSITSRVQGIRNKFRHITGNKDCEEMRLKRSEELSPDDFE